MNIKGKLIEKFNTSKITDTFKKREFVIEYAENPMYPEFVKFELIQERCDLIEAYQVGDEIEVDFNLKGRKWTDPQGEVKYFNSLQAWRISSSQETDMGQAMAQSQPQDAPPSETPSEPEWLKSSSESTKFEDDDLPF